MNLVYGIVQNGLFFSTRIEKKLGVSCPNGIYSIDVDHSDFWATLSPASSIEDARRYFVKTSNMQVVRGISFHDCFIPENPIKFSKLPVKVNDATYDEFEIIDAVNVKGKFYYFLQTVSTEKSYVLMDIRNILDENKKSIDGVKGVSPDIRILFSFHVLEKIKKEQLEPIKQIEAIMRASGADVQSVKQKNTGFEVIWKIGSTKINTWLNKDFRVIEAGFCTSGNDKTQTAHSLPNLLSEYKKDGSHFAITRSVN